MAGDFSVNSTVGVDDLGPLWEAGLEVDILVDCTHNENFQTQQSDGTVVVAKGIELDIRVSRGTATQATWTNLLGVAAAGTQATQDIVNGITGLGGFARLNQAAVKVEVPTFATDIFDPAGGWLADAVAACQADGATFDGMEDWQRKAFGMFRWPNLDRVGSEDEPRTRAG